MTATEYIVAVVKKHWLAFLIPAILVFGLLVSSTPQDAERWGGIFATRVIPVLLGYAIINYFIQREKEKQQNLSP